MVGGSKTLSLIDPGKASVKEERSGREGVTSEIEGDVLVFSDAKLKSQKDTGIDECESEFVFKRDRLGVKAERLT